ncbi:MULTISPECIES: LLM class flavin-dependent oxidoreductase [unclassified Pseudofrankia]|uniref:LLM class flavin-dependent oxidoreductase n=1 Tax=unclassified Pseudofrankia TaxID=2994372 RepID=UPI0008D94FEE|nr:MULTISPECIES: LLM class flavin-dependent oxidoreductase [unclassified Pseudofrankia]MDT3443272.1 LLM class flavin-dependent oxidoreductase [Pseudofrankia sp. BMG5.37]OHV65384.1 alkane 1-monooxygenase [Pseudofrankia sp. BMG5.36]
MHIGLGLQFAALDRDVADADVYRTELGLASRAEEVGFDSVWLSEHHFSDYQLTSQQSMVLAWLAGQTSRVKLGTMVTVLPWNDPVRVAEKFSVLDHLSGGRAILGLGRGLGQKEFVGFRVPMGESRRRFKEYSAALLTALETGVMECDGELYQQPRVEIRPRPLASFKGRTFASAVSPESMEIMAGMGVGLMVIAQKPWPTAIEELKKYRERYFELNGTEAPKPVLVIVAGVSDKQAQVDRIRDVYLQRWARSTVEHYEFDNVGFAQIEGYEYYAGLAANIQRHGLEKFNGFLADLQVWGKPAEVTEKLLEYATMTDAGGIVVPMCFGGMPAEEAQDSFELFASEVLPELRRHDVGGDIGVTYDAAPTAVS